jgi:hypothetical protein
VKGVTVASELDDEHMLTTTDNPYNPFTNYDEWWQYDTSMGYHTAAFLARIAKVSNDLSDADQELAIEQAIDEIVRENVLGIYKKAVKPT